MKNFIKRIIGFISRTNNQQSLPCPGGRLETALFVRNNSVNDFFGGWQPCDVEQLQRYQCVEQKLPEPGVIVDWLGIKTRKSYHAWLGNLEQGCVISELPFPDDSVHAEAIEYIALVSAIERAASARSNLFTVMELGASYAPWATASGVLALRQGFKNVHCIAVEASSSALDRISEHASLNGLINNPHVRFDVIHAAVYTTSDFLYFPKADVSKDNGAQVVEVESETDYRGLTVEHERVQGVTLRELTSAIERVDFLHMDLQGAEHKLLLNQDFISCLDQKVTTLFLATQSRLIEGIALDVFSKLGWNLIRERPTTYKQNCKTVDVNGWTLRDGAQIWVNPK